jgi:aspartyl-tRNA(Asn)/glutamyl-tRNA(Gln) amidotransferase subunit A
VELLSFSLDHVGFHAATVEVLRDLVAYAAFDRDDPFAEAHAGSLAAGVSLQGLRVAQLSTPDVTLDLGVTARFSQALELIRKAGATVIQTHLNVDLASERRRGLLICEAEFAHLCGVRLEEVLGAASPELKAMVEWGARQPAAKLAAAYAVFGDARRAARRLFASADVLLLPTTPQTAFSFSQNPPESQADLTVWANFAGLPAVSIPMGAADDGMPAGLQIIAPRGADGLALAVAQQIEGLLVQHE